MYPGLFNSMYMPGIQELVLMGNPVLLYPLILGLFISLWLQVGFFASDLVSLLTHSYNRVSSSGR